MIVYIYVSDVISDDCR